MIREGEALRLLRDVPDASIDALVTDPPYSSGGLMRGDRMSDPGGKYIQGANGRDFPTFSGDNRDARSWLAWCMVWLAEARRALKPGAPALVFADWRMLPTLTDAIQGGGFVWRSLIVWDKGLGARAPHTGYARHQAEYVVFASNGPLMRAPGRGPFPGVLRHTVRRADKHHMTGKPTPLMRDLVRMTPPGGLVLDPFAGSGTTGVACALEGRRFLGFELEPQYAAIARRRLREAAEPRP